jgi:hypothetical protein
MKRSVEGVLMDLYAIYNDEYDRFGKRPKVIVVPEDLFKDFIKVLNKVLKSKKIANELHFLGCRVEKEFVPGEKLKSIGFKKHKV